MNLRSRTLWTLSLLALLQPALVLGADDTAKKQATLYRDTWGVPHVYADSPRAGAFGLGYAQAEDRLSDIYISLRTGLGSMAEAFGPKWVEQDYIMRLCKNADLAKAYWPTAPPYIKEIAEGFTAGIQAYVDEHPEKVPAHALELEPWKVLTVGRAMILRWPLGTIQDDMKNANRREAPPMGSNQWSVAPSRTADNVPILLADPHLTWEGLAVMYEARVHAGDLHMNGYFLIGSPIMGIGHNQHVGWAMTTGGPDTSDVYQMKIRMNPLPQYEYDGQWKNATVSFISIPVKDSKPVNRPAAYTHLGPVMSEPDVKKGVAYVGASPYFEQNGLFEQFYRMTMAKSAKEVYDAIGMNQLNEQNIMIADVNGSIGYVRSGATPVRPDGYDWSAPVPGDTSKTAWKGLHKVDDLVHIFDPQQGYMQNCNISPENMMLNSLLLPTKYPKYIYNVSWDTNNPRSRRAVEVLDTTKPMTKEQAIALAMDVTDFVAKRWQTELKSAVAAVGKEHSKNADFAAAVDAILKWDGQFTPEATSTVAYKTWRLKCGDQLKLAPLFEGQPLDAESRTKMLDLLTATLAELKSKYGRWDIAWGDVHKVGRGGKYFPVGGADFRSGDRDANFSETLFDVRCSENESHPDFAVADNGSMAVILMFFHKDGIQSLTCTPWGQSGDAESPHYMDQGEKLYSKRQMKSTWWNKDELLKNVESQKVLTLK